MNAAVLNVLPAQLDLSAIRASLTQSIAVPPSSMCSTTTDTTSTTSSTTATAATTATTAAAASAATSTPRRTQHCNVASRRSSRHALVKSITKRLRSMKTLLNAQHNTATHQPLQTVQPAQPVHHNTYNHTLNDSNTELRGQRQQRERSEAEEGSECDGCSDVDKENESVEAVGADNERQAGSGGDKCHLDTTTEERPSTAESENDCHSSRRVSNISTRRTAAAAAAHWQRVVVALNEDNEQLRAALTEEREAAAALTAAASDRLESELESQARRYDGIIQEKDDEIGQLRQLIDGMNHTMLNNTQTLIDVQAELHHTSANNSLLHRTQLRTLQAEDDDGDVPHYPTLTPGSSPLLSPNKLTVLLDDTQDIITFDTSKHSAHKPPLAPMSPIRCAVVPSFVISGVASPLKSVTVAAAADANQLSAAWQRYLDVNQVERERQLAQLPLTSPSTPDSKRRKIVSPSPIHRTSSTKQHNQLAQQPTPRSTHPHGSSAVSAPHSVSHSRSLTTLSGAHNGAVKQLMFHTAHTNTEQQRSDAEKKEAAALAGSTLILQSAPLTHRRAESATVLEIKAVGASNPTHTNTRTRQLNDGMSDEVDGSNGCAAASSAAGEDGGSVFHSAVGRPVGGECEDGESVCLSSSDARRLSAELRRLRLLLDVKNEWNVRMKAMSGIELLSRESGIGGWSEWCRELESLRPLLCDQLTDLRSSIVREACRLLVALATASRAQFEREVDVYFPLLFKGLFVTIRVIRESCDECLQALTQRTASMRCLPALLLGCSDTHAVVRDKCGSYINTLLTAASAADLTQLEPHTADIGTAIGRLVQDSDHSARASARHLYRTFSRLFPSRAAAVHSHFPVQVQKALEAERKAGQSKQSVQASRKKK